MQATIGIDFGTTNTVMALLRPDGTSESVRFGSHDVFRTVLCFWAEQVGVSSRLHHAAGPAAIEAYLDDPLDARLIMSMKTYLAQASFQETRIFGRRFTLETMIATFLRSMLAEAGLDPAGARIVAGRPVHFAGERADDALGAQRLEAAFAEAGMRVSLALEPEGAGWRFARRLTRPATVLIGDFGGGTSDFSVLRFVPGQPVTSLGHAGIGLAGDVFDYRIIDQVVSPRLGKGGSYKVMGKSLPVPVEYYLAFARWHRLSMMRNPRTLREIADLVRTAAEPWRLRALLSLIEDEMGYRLYQTVSGVKAALSTQETAVLRFHHKELDIEEPIARAEFEGWIAGDLARLAACVDQALQRAGVGAQAIDHVFLTGGTSFVPAVRAIFTERFGAERVALGGEFVSVAEGLALIGQEGR